MKVQDLTITSHSNHTCLAITSLSSALKKDDSYYPQVLVKECRHIEKKALIHIHGNLTRYFYFSGELDKE